MIVPRKFLCDALWRCRQNVVTTKKGFIFSSVTHTNRNASGQTDEKNTFLLYKGLSNVDDAAKYHEIFPDYEL